VPAAARSPLVLVGIGVAGGFFSALFGVGGGLVVVPLLVLLAGFAAHEATGTSLAVIALTAVFGAVGFSAVGEVDWGYAALVGLPAMAGTLFAVWLQQRVSARALVLLFALFLVVMAVVLFLR
jgi:uncharacterized membrane protein YfcA